jgi:hypothetical protein
MLTKELLIKLIDYYKEHLEVIKDDNFITYLEYLSDVGLNFGICYCSSVIFEKDITEYIIDKTKTNSTGYWFKTPYFSETKEEIIECLEFRINKMTEMLKDYE